MTTERYKVREYGVGSNFGQEEIEEIARVLQTAETLAYGPIRDQFEKEFADYCGVAHAVSTTSATTALDLAAKLLHLTEGDEVIFTPQTFRASVISVASRGVGIKFADIDPRSLNIDPKTIEKKITERTKAIYVVHYGGNPVDMEPVMEIARSRGIAVVEDAAHAPGAEYHGAKIGSIGDITCFSFHSLKNMSTLGEGGMLTTNNPDYMEQAKALRTMGTVGEEVKRSDTSIGPYSMPSPPLHDHASGSYDRDWKQIDEWGNNYRMSEVQAAVGRIQLRKLDEFNRQRAEVARRYSEGLAGISGILTPVSTPQALNVWHLYPCFLDREVIGGDLEAFIHFLEEERGVQVIQRYFPLHLTDYMRYAGHVFGECPVCERVWFEEQINLPINPRMPFEEVDYVVESMAEAAKRFKR